MRSVLMVNIRIIIIGVMREHSLQALPPCPAGTSPANAHARFSVLGSRLRFVRSALCALSHFIDEWKITVLQ